MKRNANFTFRFDYNWNFVQIYQRVFLYSAILLLLFTGCAKELAPPVRELPGKSVGKIRREQRRRDIRAFWYRQFGNSAARRAERKLQRIKRRGLREESKLRQQHVKKQDPAVQKRMKESQVKAAQNSPWRNFRQKHRFWRFKKK
ncbi:MAG: hypothetical protein H6536_01840 [Bacteroidales bacterium]|nr:hypothetical protein [Bacteroidales bacterium]